VVKRTVKPSSEGLTIEVSDISGRKKEMLAAFQAFRGGRCACPTNESRKLDSIYIETADPTVRLRLNGLKDWNVLGAVAFSIESPAACGRSAKTARLRHEVDRKTRDRVSSAAGVGVSQTVFNPYRQNITRCQM
jgi:hypothetical protein